MRAAILTARSGGASLIVVAVPVAAAETLLRLEGEADQLVALAAPEPFFAVGQWYERFDQISDQAVGRLLADAARRMAGRTAG
jgi:putative phosphoribosyl transferase